MAAYLFTWDPTKWDWRNLREQSDQVGRGASVVRQWSCGTNRRISNGDTVYFIRQGREPRGLFARAEVVRGSYEAANADVQDASRGRNTLVVDVRFTDLADAVNKVVVPRHALSAKFGKVLWDIKESGVKLPEPVAEALDQVWQSLRGTAADSSTRTPAAKVEPAAAPSKAPEAAAEESLEAVEEVSGSAGVPDAALEQERLRLEREARLQKIKQRELEERKRQTAARTDTPPALSQERRNDVLVQNYFIMLDAELQGELYSKADHRNRILKELGETDAARINQEHCWISAILAETGLPFPDQFPPRAGFDDVLEKAVQVFIEGNPELIEALWIDELPPPASIPVELDDSRAHWVAAPNPTGFRPSGRPAWHPASVNEIDYRVREAQNRNLAMAGERFVLAFERARLREAGKKELLDRVAWQSQTFGDSFGYDIRSLEDDGGERKICVKTTNYGARFPFQLTNRELERAQKNPDHFYLYRVFNFSRRPQLFILPGRQLLNAELETVSVRAWF